MTSRKTRLAVSISTTLVEKMKAVVFGGRARSVSAYVEHAVAAQLAAEADFDGLIEQALEESGGPPTQAERMRARKTLRRTAA